MPKIRIMLDSGAFSAWNRGEKIDLGEYIKFIQANANLLDTYINLDVIPGVRGVRPTQVQVNKAAAASLENYQVMRKAGLNPIPVFHFGEGFEWLMRLLEAGADYICLGGTVGVATRDKREFFDKCFTILTNAYGEPLVKVHGLGVSEGSFIARYPWQSVDSTSWAIAPIYGHIRVPGSRHIHIGSETEKWGSNRRFSDLPLSVQERVLKFAVEECKVSLDDLRNDVYARTITFIRTLQLMRSAERLASRLSSFTIRSWASDRSGIKTDFRMVFATNLSHRQGWLLVRCGANDRLLSYADLRRNQAALQEYVEKGVAGHLKEWPVNERVKVDWKSGAYRDDRRKRLVARLKEGEDGSPRITRPDSGSAAGAGQ